MKMSASTTAAVHSATRRSGGSTGTTSAKKNQFCYRWLPFLATVLLLAGFSSFVEAAGSGRGDVLSQRPRAMLEEGPETDAEALTMQNQSKEIEWQRADIENAVIDWMMFSSMSVNNEFGVPDRVKDRLSSAACLKLIVNGNSEAGGAIRRVLSAFRSIRRGASATARIDWEYVSIGSPANRALLAAIEWLGYCKPGN
ncbi:unnamed protein product [Amoebophrya sp. A25]|nr:unnamed protein product [Amoebophrya sp. A25]|eukprot:GSA25T00009375001.1